MAMLTVGISGTDTLSEKLAIVQEALDIDKVADQGAALLLHRIRERFLKQVGPDKIPWVPSFAALRRARTGRGGGTLFNTGRMFHSIQVFTMGPGSRDIGTDVPYAPKHNFGIGQIRRQFLGFNDDDVTAVTDAIIFKVQQALRKK